MKLTEMALIVAFLVNAMLIVTVLWGPGIYFGEMIPRWAILAAERSFWILCCTKSAISFCLLGVIFGRLGWSIRP